MAEATASATTEEVSIQPSYERPVKKPATRCLRLTADKPIELILGQGHIIKLRRGDDGVARISMDGFQLPDPQNADDFLDELELPANANIDIRRRDSKPDVLVLEKMEDYNEPFGRRVADYYIYLPNKAVNLRGQKIDFTDIRDEPFSGLSIAVGAAGKRAEDNMVFITNHNGDGGLVVAAPGKTTP